jgi:hypothetical protein
LAHAEARTGESILFWHDLWNGQVLKLAYPQLFSFTLMEEITLASVLQHENFHDIFQLPLSEEAYQQFCEVNVIIQSIQENTDIDRWKYIWGSGNFSAKKAYNHLSGQQRVYPAIVGFGALPSSQSTRCFFGS